MPRHESPKKRMRQDKRKALRNKAELTRIKSSTKKLAQSSSASEAGRCLSECTSVLDKAVKRHVVHRGTADRTKSRLAKLANKLGSAPKAS